MTKKSESAQMAEKQKKFEEQYKEFFVPVISTDWTQTTSLAQPSPLKSVESVGSPHSHSMPTIY